MAGAEFAVLLAPPAGLAEGRFLAGGLVEAIGRPFMSADHVITLGSRAGVAVSQPGDDAAGLLRRASVAPAEAKAAESAPIRVIEDGAESETERGERLEVDLRRALDRGEIEILFQPQVSVTSGEVLGARRSRAGSTRIMASSAPDPVQRRRALRLSRRPLRPCAAPCHRRRGRSRPEALARLRLSVNITAADIRRPGFADQFELCAKPARPSG